VSTERILHPAPFVDSARKARPQHWAAGPFVKAGPSAGAAAPQAQQGKSDPTEPCDSPASLLNADTVVSLQNTLRKSVSLGCLNFEEGWLARNVTSPGRLHLQDTGPRRRKTKAAANLEKDHSCGRRMGISQSIHSLELKALRVFADVMRCAKTFCLQCHPDHPLPVPTTSRSCLYTDLNCSSKSFMW